MNAKFSESLCVISDSNLNFADVSKCKEKRYFFSTYVVVSSEVVLLLLLYDGNRERERERERERWR